MHRLNPAKWPLALRLTVNITAIVVLVVAGITLLAMRREQAVFRAQTEQQAELLLNTLSVSTADHLPLLDVDYLNSLADELLRVPGVLSVSFYDRQGLPVADPTDPQDAQQSQIGPYGTQLVASEELLLDWQSDRLVAGRAIIVEGQRLGAVAVEFSDNLLRTEVSPTLELGIVVLFLAGLAGTGLAAVVSRSVTEPVRKLVAATHAVVQGDLISEVVTEGAYEVTLLRDSFNSMTAHLREAIERLWREIDVRTTAEEEVRAALKEKEVLLREVHHRVKNNLQFMISLLALQSRGASDEQVSRALNESRERIHSMAAIHEILYQSPDLAHLGLAEYMEGLAAHLQRTYAGESQAIRLSSNVTDATLGVDKAVYCGLIIHELTSNAIQHAFPDGRSGEITIDLSMAGDGQLVLCVSDDGVGLPGDVEPGGTSSLGLELVSLMTRQLDGTLHVERDGGTAYKIVFSP